MIVLRQRGVVDEFRGGMVFQRSSLAYDQRGRLYGLNQARFETIAGRRGIRIEEGTMNLISNPSFGADSNSDGVADGWSFVSYGATASLVSDTLFGTKSQRITSTAGDTGIARRVEKTIPITGGATYVFSGYLKTDGVASGKLRIDANGTNPLTIESTPESPTTWRRQSIVFTAPADATQVIVRCYNSAPQGVAGWVQWNGVQLEQKPYATSFVDGTRDAESLTIPTAGILSPTEGTISMWIYRETGDRLQMLLDGGGTGVNGFNFRVEPTNKLQLQFGMSGVLKTILSTTNVPVGQWVHVSVGWDETGVDLTVQGEQAGSTTDHPVDVSLYSDAGIGYNIGRTDRHLNGFIADLHISSVRRSIAERVADYARGYHVPDQYTTFYHPLDGPDSQRAARSIVV